MYNKAGKKLGFAIKAWLFIILLKITAWMYTIIPAIITLERIEKSSPIGIWIMNLVYDSRNSKFNLSGGCSSIGIRIKKVYAKSSSRLIGFVVLN